jgi:hypothetical protein
MTYFLLWFWKVQHICGSAKAYAFEQRFEFRNSINVTLLNWMGDVTSKAEGVV